MPNYRSVLINALKGFCLNSPSDGYDWGELYDSPFELLTDAELYNLLNHYLNYMKGE